MSEDSKDLIIERLERELMHRESDFNVFRSEVSNLESRIIDLERKICQLEKLVGKYFKVESGSMIEDEWPKTSIGINPKEEYIIVEDIYSDPLSSKFEGRGQLIIAEDTERVLNCSERICLENEDIIITE